jgi:hypothetical protein
MGTAGEDEPQPLARELGTRGDAWIRRIEADTRMRDTFEGAGGGQQARFVRRGLPHTACMPSQSCRQRESTTLDSEGIGH